MKIALFTALGLLVFGIWYFESRDYICSDKGKCITDWKMPGHNRYIIPGRFYGLLKPSDSENYIKAEYKSTGMIFIWRSGVDTLLVQLDSSNRIVNNNKKKTQIIYYNSNRRYYDPIYTYYDEKHHIWLFKENVQRVAIPLEDSEAL